MICSVYPTFGIADGSYLFGAPYGEEVERRSSIPSTNLTMANADADRISLDLKSNFAAIAAARPIPHLELLCRFVMAVSRTTRGHDPVMTATLNVDSGRPLRAKPRTFPDSARRASVPAPADMKP